MSTFELFMDKHFIDGQWLFGEADVITVTNPATGEQVRDIKSVSNTQIEQAIQAAHLAFKTWSTTAAKQRAQILEKWHHLIIDNIDDLAHLLTTEQGKTLAEARKEIRYGADFIKWFAEEAKKICGDVVQHNSPNQQIFTVYEPIGVIAAITPWNFPSAMIARKVAPAIASGCTIVLKPSDLTPLSAIALARLAELAGLPKGVLNVIIGDAPTIGQIFSQHKHIKKISFTGSTAVGRLLYQQAAPYLKKVVLELGGNAPFIVFNDADLELATTELVNNKIRSSGQACIAANRVFVHTAVKSKFLEILRKKFLSLKVGNGLHNDTIIGPVINRQAVEKINRLVDGAAGQGATKIIDELNLNTSHNLFYPPTILDNCTTDMDIFNEEIFGPVIALYEFTTDDELIMLANKTTYGLSAYFYSNNHARIWQITKLLDFGVIGINEGFISNEFGAFAGRKDSGFGIEGSSHGIYEFLQTKYICMKY